MALIEELREIAQSRNIGTVVTETALLARAANEIERLLRLLDWCRPRLKRDDYRISLDKMIANPSTPDHSPVVQSAK